MDRGILVAALGSQWRLVSVDEALRAGKVDLLFMDGFKQFDKRMYALRSALKSRVDAPSLSDKRLLHETLHERGAGRFICETHVVRRGEPFALPSGTWIWRPDRVGGGGKGIRVVTSQLELERAREADAREDRRGKPSLLSRYIDDPLLLQDGGAGYKFHLRVYYLVVCDAAGTNRAAVFKEGEIARAREPYVPGPYSRVSHDTHLKSHFEVAPPMRFPRDFPGGAAASAPVLDQIVSCLAQVSTHTLPGLRPYEETDAAYNLFGCDFLVDAAGRTWLLEINKTPYLDRGAGTADQTWLSTMLCEAIVAFAVRGVHSHHLVACGECTRPPAPAASGAAATTAATGRKRGQIAVQGSAILHGRDVGVPSSGHSRGTKRAAPGSEGRPPPTKQRKGQTVLAMLEHMRVHHLEQMLVPFGWEFVSCEEAFASRRVDLVVLDGVHNSDNHVWKIRSRMKSRIDAEIITNKVELHLLLTRMAPHIIPETYLATSKGFDAAVWGSDAAHGGGGAPWIWRPEGKFEGEGIFIFRSRQEADVGLAALKPTDSQDRQDRRPRRAILSRYIQNPVLYHGRKVHLRLYFIVVCERGGVRAAVLRDGRVGTAGGAYRTGEYGDMQIHDSGCRVEDLRFPGDYPECEGQPSAAQVFSKSCDIFTEVMRHTHTSVKSYSESDEGFEVLGADLMVDTDGRVWLIEINYKPGHRGSTAEYQDWLSTTVLTGITRFALKVPGPAGERPPHVQVWPPSKQAPLGAP